MKFVKRIINVKRIGQTSDGYGVDASRVEYTDGTLGILYRLNRGDGKIYGLQAQRPTVCDCEQGVLIKEVA